ncbi:adenylate/guanylate cyclase domain-containing protein [uncultured Psychroserpens sp.]|uniref:adenylate/guanylate cyclase domain-containing protein n=1 Tax=uncultured Psychroserpens sp. TaxID=255436 RepID=UPI002634DAD1|nr:adenylate/guanylate cyclase domain-containing protein [uncultured Psychroserpens sp.]
MKLLQKKLHILKAYLIGWFIASIIWYMASKFSSNTINFINQSFTNDTVIFLVTWISQALLYGLLHLAIDRFIKNRVAFYKLQVYSLFSQIITAVFLILIIFFSFKITKVISSKITILEFLDKLDGLWIVFLYALIVNFAISTIIYIDLVLGRGNLLKMISGKFYTPKEDEKVFMFLDLKSSTTYAEKLGHIKYSRLIQDCFHDLAIVNDYKARIYQYVGDEAVLTWSIKDGIEHNNCINAFFAFKDVLNEKSTYYQKNYGLVPEFKAGVNLGIIMVTEVGVLKREIAYHGDTINTTSRLEGECNRLGAELVISENVLNAIDLNAQYAIKFEDNLLLKGKNTKVKMYSLKKTT